MQQAWIGMGTVLCALVCSAPTQASVLSYGVTALGGAQWRYDYTLETSVETPLIEQFTIHFDRQLFDGLVLVGSPAGWDSIVVQPDQALPSNGFIDSLALGPGLGLGMPLTGLSASFTFLGTGSPGAQSFDIVDPVTFSVIESGLTLLVPSNAVSEPAANWLLLVSGLALLASCVRTEAKRPD